MADSIADVAARLWQEQATTNDGKVDTGTVIDDLVLYIARHPEIRDDRRQATSAVQHLDAAMRPKVSEGSQLAFYDPDAFLATGPSQRVQMAQATRTDVAQAAAMDAQRHAVITGRYAVRSAAYAEWLGAWQPTDPTLAAVEARLHA